MRKWRRLVPSPGAGRLFVLGFAAVAAVSAAALLTFAGGSSIRAARAAAPAAAKVPASSVPTSTADAALGLTPPATGGRVIVVLKDQHSSLNLKTQGQLRRRLAFADQAPILNSIRASNGTEIQQLVAVNAVAAKLSAREVTALKALPQVAKVVPNLPVQSQSGEVASASVPNSQVMPDANPAPCPAATATSPLGVTGVVQEPESDSVLHASDGIANDPDMANSVPTGTSLAPAIGTGVVVANNNVNVQAGNPNFIRPNGQPVTVNLPPADTTANTGNDEFDEDESSVAAQGTVIYQYDTGIGTGQTGATNQGALPFSGLPPTCKFYILGDAPGASMVDDSDITTPPTDGKELESDYIAFVDHVTDAALPAFQTDEISLSLGGGTQVPQTALTANDAAVAAGVSVFVSSGDAGESSQSGSTMNPMAADPLVMDLGGTDGNRIIALNDGFQSYVSNQIAAIGSSGVGTTFRVVDVVAPAWFSGEAACGNGGGCNTFYPTESSQGTSSAAPLTAGGAADVIQAYRNTHNGTSPTPALQKSIIDGTATDLDSPASVQGSGMLNIYRAVEAAMQMPGTTDPNGPPADARELIPTPSQLDVKGAAGTTATPTVSLYNTNTTATTVTGMWRNMGPQFDLQAPMTENLSAPAYGTPIPERGATAAAPITFTVPAGLDRLEMSEITPDPTNNTMVQIYLLDPEGRLVQDSYDDGSVSQGITTLGTASAVGDTNIKVASLSSAVVGNKVSIDSLGNQEVDTVSSIGTAASNATLSAATLSGATTFTTTSANSIAAGDTVTIDTATNQETAVVSSVSSSGGRNPTFTITLTAPLKKAHASGAPVTDPGNSCGALTAPCVTLTTPLTIAHAAGAAVYFSGTGTEPNIQEIEVSAPEPGTWTAEFVWNGIDQEEGDAPPVPGLYTGPMNVDIQGSKWQTSPATAPVTIPAHSSATIPISYQFPGTPGDYPQSIQFSADDGGTTSFPFVGRSIIPTGFNVPFNTLITSSVGRSGGPGQINQYNVNVPAGSSSISVNLTTPDASADNKFTYFLVSPALTDPSNTVRTCTPPACVTVTEPQTVNGVLTNNGTLTVNNPPPGLWQVDVELTLNESGKQFTQVVSGSATVTPSVSVGGTVASTLGLSLPPNSAPNFGAFTPGVAQTYSQTVPITVTSTAASTMLTASDANIGFPAAFSGHLVNTSTGGPYALAQGLEVSGSDSANTPGSGVFTDLSVTNPATLLSYGGPVSNDPVTVTLQQPIAATDPLRTGSYSKTITLSLTTNTP